MMAHDGIARAIRPAHTPFDGDTVFAVASGGIELSRDSMRRARGPHRVGGGRLLSRAVARAVHHARAPQRPAPV